MSTDSKPTLFTPGIGKRGMNELHYAAYSGDQNELESWLKIGLNPNIKDNYRGYSALHWLADMAAIGGPRTQMLRLLVAHGADVNLIADNGETAISLANASGSSAGEMLVKDLLLLGATS